jgi:hypothetical protein
MVAKPNREFASHKMAGAVFIQGFRPKGTAETRVLPARLQLSPNRFTPPDLPGATGRERTRAAINRRHVLR